MVELQICIYRRQLSFDLKELASYAVACSMLPICCTEEVTCCCFAGTLSLTVAIIHANFITSDGKSHYLMGVQLICSYLIISAAFLF